MRKGFQISNPTKSRVVKLRERALKQMRHAEVLRFVWPLYICLSLPRAEAAADKAPKNQKEFKALCLFYNLVGKASEKQASSESLNEMSEELVELQDGLQDLKAIGRKLRSNATEAPITVKFAQESFEITPGINMTAAKDRLATLEAKLEEAFKNVNESKDKVEKLFRDAFSSVKEARFGSQGEEWATTGTGSGVYAGTVNRQNTCVGAASPTCADATSLRAGCSLAHDMFCLCLPGQGSSTALDDFNWCGVSTGSVAGWYTGTMTTKASIGTDWTNLKNHCDGLNEQVEFTAEGISKAIGSFESLLGAGIQTASSLSNANKYKRVLGYTVATTGEPCTGANGGGTGICVNYGGTSGEKTPIKWLEKFELALKNLTAARKEREKLQRLIRKADKIKEAAITILNQISLPTATLTRLNQASGAGTQFDPASPIQKAPAQQMDNVGNSRRLQTWILFGALLS